MRRHPKNKYMNEKVEVDGLKFDSRKEAKRYRELKLMQELGLITNLECQKKYVLIPAKYKVKNNKKTLIERECYYKADFAYTDHNGEVVVEDVKGYKHGQAYTVFVIKRKLMLQEYGIQITEV